MTAIVDIIGREILDSRGNPTVEVDVVLESGALGRAAAVITPSCRASAHRDSNPLPAGRRSRLRESSGGILQAILALRSASRLPKSLNGRVRRVSQVVKATVC